MVVILFGYPVGVAMREFRVHMIRLAIITVLFFWPVLLSANTYPWLGQSAHTHQPFESLINIPLPEGFERVPVAAGSFAHWLRYLPVKKDGALVYAYTGQPIDNQTIHRKVVAIEVGTSDLQQCADAAIRLRSEYLFSQNRFGEIVFNFTNGTPARYLDWRNGLRPIVTGNKVKWEKKQPPNSSYESFRKYLDTVFMYAGSYSLSKELPSVPWEEMQSGDLFVDGGFPGHVVIVVDQAVDSVTGERIFMLAQGYTPAQSIHVLRNLNEVALDPWYVQDPNYGIDIPSRAFGWQHLRRFK